MLHKTNIKDFKRAISGGSDLIAAYCGLVAIELILKSEISLGDHDVCFGLNKLGIQKGVGTLGFHKHALLALSNQLRRDLSVIHVNGKDGAVRLAPPNSYPYLRYTRIEADGWPAPFCRSLELSDLSKTVSGIRAYLRIHFGYAL